MDRRRGFRWIVGFALLSAVGSGCNTFAPHVRPKPVPAAPVERPAVAAIPEGETRLAYHTRLVDQPAGSDYLNSGLWADATDHLDHERTTLLALNGLRLGVVAGNPPAELERLASSDATVLSPMLRSGAAGRPRAIPVNGPLASCTLGTVSAFGGEAKPKTFDLVECGLTLTSTVLPGDRLKVRGEFQIQHGERQPWLRPTSDGTGFARTDRRASESYPALAFEVTLGRADLLVLGATDEPAGKLGQAFFFSIQPDRVRQRVLLVQVGATEAPNGARPGR